MLADPSHRWWSYFREIGSVSIVHLELTPHAEHEASAFLWLNEEERSRWRKFEHPGARRRFVLCRAALRSLLCDELLCSNDRLSFEKLEHGKPVALVNGSRAQVSFNVSHGGNHGLIAISPQGHLGVDVEERTPRRDFDRLIDAAFGPNEQYDLKLERARGEYRLFFKLWTIKEALIKALGTGLSLDPATFEAPMTMRRGATSDDYEFPHMPGVVWHVEEIGNEEFAAALAYDV